MDIIPASLNDYNASFLYYDAKEIVRITEFATVRCL